MRAGQTLRERKGHFVMKKQKGQTLVEFTLILPFFLLLIFGLIYSGMLFYDYSTLSNMARSAARERAITPTTGEGAVDNPGIVSFYYDGQDFTPMLVTGLYHPAANALQIKGPSSESNDIIVTITMELGDSSYIMRQVLPPTYTVVYHMRKEN